MASPLRSLKRHLRRIADVRRFERDLGAFIAQQARTPDALPIARRRDEYRILGEWTGETAFEPHYTYHPAWAARILARTRPAEHVDISSSLAFVAMISGFVPLRFYDYRPANLKLAGLTCDRADLLALPFADRSVPSLSCMHVVEHVGLGRYGDPVDAAGDQKAIRELCRVLAPGGDLLFVVPVGRERVAFNAHRVYAAETILSRFGGLDLVRMDLIPDDAARSGMIEGATVAQANAQEFGCGCFWFKGRPG